MLSLFFQSLITLTAKDRRPQIKASAKPSLIYSVSPFPWGIIKGICRGEKNGRNKASEGKKSNHIDFGLQR
jgi:hypothetical protein